MGDGAAAMGGKALRHKKSTVVASNHRADAVEMRGVEPLSEGSCAELSPSAVCDLTFPQLTARRQADSVSSFMLRTHGKA